MDGAVTAVIKTPTANPQGAAAAIVAQRKPYFIEEMSEWPVNLPPIPVHVLETNQIGALVALPLIIGWPGQEEVVGVVLISLRAPQAIDATRRRDLWCWAQQVALFVQNARVLRRRRREEEAFQIVSTAAGAGDPDATAAVIAQQVRRLTKCAFVTVLAHLSAEQQLTAQGIRLHLTTRSINAHAVATRRPYYAPDLRQDPHHVTYLGWDEGMAAAYSVPLLMNDQVIGAIYLTSTDVDGIALDDRNFMEKLAPHAAVALHYAGLIQEERAQRESQAQELADARDNAIASEAVAWFGITAADRQHTLAQKIGSLRYCTDTLQLWAQRHGLANDEWLQEVINDVNSIADDIQSFRSEPLTTTGSVPETPTLIDRELRSTVQRWCDQYNQEEDAAITYRFDLQCPGLRVGAPANILRIATEKVVHNALKAMAHQGELTVCSRRLGEQIAIDIEDSGPGIPAFARPYFLKRPIQRPAGATGQGTGMGAHIARLIARRYRGDLILLESSENGTKLRLTFPIVA
jgi:signal transduction histidine kinase